MLKTVFIVCATTGLAILVEIYLFRLQNQIDNLHEQILKLNQTAVSRQELKAGQVAFHVTISTHMNNVPPKTVLVFDKAITNVGHGYNPQNGIFTVPKDGVYHFTWNYLTKKGGISYIYLIVNSKVCQVSCLHTSGSVHEAGSGFYVSELKKDDKIWLEISYTKTTFLHSEYTTFSGFRVN